jgi:hypothetical protein
VTALTDYFENQLILHLFRTGDLTLAAWTATTAYSLGDIVRPATWDNRFYECVVAGTSAGAEPTFNTTLGDETTDNDITWQAIAPGVPKREFWVALFTAAPGETGGGTEVSGGSYARVRYGPADAHWDPATGGDGLTDNASAIVFPAPTAAWGVVSDTAVVNRSSGAIQDMFWYGSLTTSKTVNNGDPAPQFNAGDFDFTWA